MSGPEPEAGRLLDSLRRTGQHLQGLVTTRLELASVELAEQKIHLAQIVWFAAGVAVFAIVALLCLTFAVVVFTWDTAARVWVLPGFVVLYGALGFAMYRGLRRRLRDDPPPFAGTVEEFRRDRAWFSNEN
jgi:uncharacterized membrane protein YqjE